MDTDKQPKGWEGEW